MIGYFLKTLATRLAAGRSLFLLTLLGVALGVAAVLSIQIINLNALGAFQGSVRAVSGEAQLTVVGRMATFSEELLVGVLEQPGVEAAWPLYRVDVALAGEEEVYLQVVGIDLLAPRDLPWDSAPETFGSPLNTLGWVALTPQFAQRMRLAVGDALEVTSGSRRVGLRVGAQVDFRRVTPLAGSRLAVMDIAQAQHLFGGRGRLHQIDVRLADGADPERVASELASRLGPGVRVVTPEQRRFEAAGMLGAFRLNLTALSLVSLFVGGFLVYASTQASLLRRRAELGLLRSLGATRGQLLAQVLGEVAILGVLGVLVGLPLGYAAASYNVELVSKTLTNLYLLEEIETLALPPWLFVLAALIGVGSAVGGALFPALDLCLEDARTLLAAYTMQERVGRVAAPLFVAGWTVVAASGAIAFVLKDVWRPAGFVLGVGLVIGLPLMAPAIVSWWTRRMRLRGFGLRHGVKALGLRLQTSAFAVAALAVAVTMLVGITLMIGSFRRTVEIWLTESARADVYVTSESWRRARESATLDAQLVGRLSAMPGVRAVDTLRQFFVDAGGRRIALGAADLGPGIDRGRFSMYAGEPAEALRRAHEDGAALISEPLSRKAGLEIGDELIVSGPRGPVGFLVSGVYYDYSSEGGSAAIDLRTMERIFGPGDVNSVALYLEPDLDPERMVDALKARFAGRPLEIRSNRDLREQVFAIFDQTFAVTRLLQGMSLLIAACGITLTLIVLARERISELALYRALGARRRQIFRVFVGKGLGIGLFGIGLGSVGGIALAFVLIFVVNRAYFGWTIALHWPWGALARQIATIVAVSVAASLYPALRASRTPATELSSENL